MAEKQRSRRELDREINRLEQRLLALGELDLTPERRRQLLAASSLGESTLAQTALSAKERTRQLAATATGRAVLQHEALGNPDDALRLAVSAAQGHGLTVERRAALLAGSDFGRAQLQQEERAAKRGRAG